MKAKHDLIINLCIGALAFIIVVIDQLLKGSMPIGADKGFTYVAFIAWAVYFFTGTGKDGIRAWLGYLIGMTFSIGIILLAGVFGFAGSFVSVPLAVLVVVAIVLYLEKTQWTNYIPAMFVASGTYFGIMNYVPEASFGTAFLVEFVYGTIGLIFGWITVTGKTWYLDNVAK